MSRILALGLALASWGFLTISAAGVVAFQLGLAWPGAVLFIFGLALDAITYRFYGRIQRELTAGRRARAGHVSRQAEIGVIFYLIALFFLLAFVQGSGGPIFGLDPRLGACLALMGALFVARLFFAMKRARATEGRLEIEHVEPLPELLMETPWAFLVLLVFPLFVLPALQQRLAFNIIGYGLGLAVSQAAFLLIFEGEPGLQTIYLLLAFPASLFFCAFLIPIFARSPLLAARR
jgi:hypothetical protein